MKNWLMVVVVGVGACAVPEPHTTDVTVAQQDIVVLTEKLDALSQRIQDLEARTVAISSEDLDGDGSLDVVVSGANLFIVNGTGDTATLNGAGNLILGYNVDALTLAQDGSHNLIIGDGHSFTSYAGIVAGTSNSILAPNASVLGGELNVAQGANSGIVAGALNTASGGDAAVLGGRLNLAAGAYATVSGGDGNSAVGESCAVAGGSGNRAGDGDGNIRATVLGGFQNVAAAPYAAVVGGQENNAFSGQSVVLGGFGNDTDAPFEIQPSGSAF